MTKDLIAKFIAKRLPEHVKEDLSNLQSVFCPAKLCYARCNPNNCPPVEAQQYNILQLMHILSLNNDQKKVLVEAAQYLKSSSSFNSDHDDDQQRLAAFIVSLVERMVSVEEFVKELLKMRAPFVLKDYYGEGKELVELFTPQELDTIERQSRRSDYAAQHRSAQKKRIRVHHKTKRIIEQRHKTEEQRFRIDDKRQAYIAAREKHRKPV